MITKTHTILSAFAASMVTAALCGAAVLPGGGVPPVGTPGGPTNRLTPADEATWLAGRAIFDKRFNRAEGLGTPEMNADSCRACHQDPVLGGAGGLELNVSRFAKDNNGAGPFENLAGGQGASKLRPPWEAGRENIHPDADVFEQRQTPSALGLGLLDAIPNSAILANEDPDDLNGDFIIGKARILMVNGQPEVGRFGWKAQIPRLADFVDDAMAGETGITTPDNGRGFNLSADADSVADPELSAGEVDDLAFFLLNLGPPIRTGSTSALVVRGEQVFTEVLCSRCHIPSMPSPNGPVFAYTDLLLHDVMPVNFRGMSEPGAESGFYRTPPLWGIKDTAPYMHDGRAEDLPGAIAAHFGEADQVRQNYEALTDREKTALILFLQDL